MAFRGVPTQIEIPVPTYAQPGDLLIAVTREPCPICGDVPTLPFLSFGEPGDDIIDPGAPNENVMCQACHERHLREPEN